MKKIAVFDFDHTLFKQDSLIAFCLYIYRRYPWRALYGIVQLVGLFLHRLGILSTRQFKNLFIGYLIAIPKKKVDRLVNDFWTQHLNAGFNKELLELIGQHKEKIEIVCVSASPQFMFTLLMKHLLQIDVCISTPTTYSYCRYRICGQNCRGSEKIKRLNEYYSEGYELILAVSDNEDDQELLNMATTQLKVVNGRLVKP